MPKKAVKGEELTEEERLLQLQHRAQAEEEMAKKKEETLALFLKDKLQKEQRNTAVNLLKLTDSWRRSLRQSRAAELLADGAVLQQTSERHLDQLSSIIQRMAGELQEAERQAEQLRRCHLQQVERLWEQQQEAMLKLQQQWESSMQDLGWTCGSERRKMSADLRQQNHRLADLSLPSLMHHQTLSAGVGTVYQEVVDSCVSADQEQQDDLSDEGEWQDEDGVVTDVLQDTRDSLDDLQRRFPEEQQQLNAELRNLKRLKDTVLRLRQQTVSCQAEEDLMRRRVSAAKLDLSRRSRQLQDRLERERREARRTLTDLSVRAGAAVQNLRAVICKGEKLLQAAELSSKMEDRQEVLAVAEENRQEVLAVAEEENLAQQEAQEEVQEFQEVREVQRRLNAALLRREALRNHGKDLRTQNQQLQVLLDLQDHSLQGRRAPLPVLRAPVAPGPPAAPRRRHNVTEAAHIAKHCLVDSRG